MSEDDTPYFLAANSGLSEIGTDAEMLHPEAMRTVSADSLSETQYFGFSIPDERILGVGYLWHHPNLGIVTGGLLVFQGIKRRMQDAEICDFLGYVNDRCLQNGLRRYELPNSYSVEVITPLKRHRLTYEDKERNSAVDIIFEAASPPVMWAAGHHFEQALHVRGSLLLRGKSYRVDGVGARDRSWGQSRPENNMDLPPVSWMNGAFPSGLSFNANLFDDARGNPELDPAFARPPEKIVNGGWIYRDGKLGRIISGQKTVLRSEQTLFPESIQFDVNDELGRTLRATGQLLAALPWQAWPNSLFHSCLMQWTVDGEIGHGDIQEALWTDYLNRFAK